MFIYPGGESLHFAGELQQRGGVAFGELVDAAGEGLRYAVEFALHGGGQRGQPLVIHHEQLDLALLEKEAATSAKVKDAQDALMAKVAAQYGKLTEAEIKTLVVNCKWLATLAASVQSELDRVSQTLTGRIRQLAERYAIPLPQLTGEVATLAARVDEHLKKMGARWN